MTRGRALGKLRQLEQAIKALPVGVDVLAGHFNDYPQHDHILLSIDGSVPEAGNVETTVESSGATAKTVVICGIRVKWYPKSAKKKSIWNLQKIEGK